MAGDIPPARRSAREILATFIEELRDGKHGDDAAIEAVLLEHVLLQSGFKIVPRIADEPMLVAGIAAAASPDEIWSGMWDAASAYGAAREILATFIEELRDGKHGDDAAIEAVLLEHVLLQSGFKITAEGRPSNTCPREREAGRDAFNAPFQIIAYVGAQAGLISDPYCSSGGLWQSEL